MSEIVVGRVCTRANTFETRSMKGILFSLMSVVLASCAIHPVQQDVTGVPTKIVVDRIRCEARLAVLDKAIDLLDEAIKKYQSEAPPIAEKFAIIARHLNVKRHELGPITFDPLWLPTTASKQFFTRYANTVIAYDFLMQGVEDNKVALAVDPVRLITGGTAGVTLGGSSELMRDNQRHFSLSDTFAELLFSDKLKCAIPEYMPENFAYPVSGNVGMKEVISTFIDLNEDKPLAEIDTTAKTVFADTLKFTTTLMGSATPHVQIDPIGNQFGLASPATVGLSGSRTDTHTLTVGLAMGPPQTVPLLSFPFVARTKSAITARIQQTNRDAAFQAIQDLRIRSFLDRAGTLLVR